MQTIPHWLDGAPYGGHPAGHAPVLNPALGQPIRELALASMDDVNHVVARSLAAFASWSQTTAPQRPTIMLAMRALLIEHADTLARIIGEEHGKTVPDAKGEIQRGIEVVEFAAGVPHLLKGDHSANVGGAIDIFSMRAQTKEATLQVQLARLQYSLPRLARMWAHLDRQGGGSGGGKGGGAAARGEGEKQVEVDRRLARAKIDRVKAEIEVVRKQHRSVSRNARVVGIQRSKSIPLW